MPSEEEREIVEIDLAWTEESLDRRLHRLRDVLGWARAKDPVRILDAIGDYAAKVVAAAQSTPKEYASAQRTLASAINRELEADDAPAQLQQISSTSAYRLVNRVSNSMKNLMTGAFLVSVAVLIGVVVVGVMLGRAASWPWLAAYAGLFLFTAGLGRVGKRLRVRRAYLVVAGTLASILWVASAAWPLWTSGQTTAAAVFVSAIVLTQIVTRVVDRTLRRLDPNLPDPS